MTVSSGNVQQRPRRRLDDVRRPQILAKTVALIGERGLWDVRLADVAKRAGISATSVVYYFGSKDQLFAQAIAEADDSFYEPLLTELEELDSAAERIACLFVRSSTSDWPLWMDLWVYSRHHPETANSQRAFHERWRRTIADVVAHGCERGEWSVADPDAVALRLSALTDGLAVHMVLGDAEHTPEAYVAMSLAAASLELGCEPAELERAARRLAAPPR
ncbi:MAG TPA: TetR/AcrR family transcriptional regulator [Solirubrobacteraceae bacterium]|jgi:AcrR family transcriptional regulator